MLTINNEYHNHVPEIFFKKPIGIYKKKLCIIMSKCKWKYHIQIVWMLFLVSFLYLVVLKFLRLPQMMDEMKVLRNGWHQSRNNKRENNINIFCTYFKKYYLNYFFPLNFPDCDIHNFSRLVVNNLFLF